MRLSVDDFPTVEADTVPAGLGRWTFAGDVDGFAKSLSPFQMTCD